MKKNYILYILSIAFILNAEYIPFEFKYLCLWKNLPEHALQKGFPLIKSITDHDCDGISDTQELLAGARSEVIEGVTYCNEYYEGGYPPKGKGVCTDTIWRAFERAGYSLKNLVDQDIEERQKEYRKIKYHQDPNIDFRRIEILRHFFKKYANPCSHKLEPYDYESLSDWQPGDIIILNIKEHYHIAIISDRRRIDGVPYIVHNGGPIAREEDRLLYWKAKGWAITDHFRWGEVKDKKEIENEIVPVFYTSLSRKEAYSD